MKRLWSPIAAVVLLVSSACGDEASGELLVDVQTDLRPGLEFASARTTVAPVDGSEAPRVGDEAATRGDDGAWLSGFRVFELSTPPIGEIRVRVELLASDGAVVAAQQRRLRFAGPTRGVSLVIGRDCAGVTCPAPGAAPAQAACLAGACVDEACGPDAPDECPAPTCTADGECTASVACASGRCVSGQCLVVVDDGACDAGQMCDASRGCVDAVDPPDSGPRDAGMDAADSGAAECADDDDCTGCPYDSCIDGRCAATPLHDFTAGGYFNCAVLEPSRQAYCWGFNGEGQLGNDVDCGGDCRIPRPQPVSFAGTWEDLEGQWKHACGIDDTGTLHCWGDNGEQQLGNPAAGLIMRSPLAVETTNRYTRLVEGIGTHTCALRADGLDCWGDDTHGQLGRGPSPTRGQVGGVTAGTGFTRAGSGRYHTCAIDGSDGRLWCWGRNTVIQLDIGTNDDIRFDIPQQTVLDAVFTDVVTGQAHTCAIHGASLLSCWGSNGAGAVGNGDTSFETGRYLHGGTWDDVAAGHDHTCAIRTDGSLWCWGENEWGQTGQSASPAAIVTPTRVGADDDWDSLYGGFEHTCAIKNDGSVWCWGRNTAGQLGQGTTGDASSTEVPQPVCVRPDE